MQNRVLVSCTVVSYNSAKTIIETLNSIKAQTYQNIELIVSDDCSKDNTVEICRDWIEKNKNRFVRVELITSDHNTGVSGNGNRALAACLGEWQKGIAADDILLPDCVESFVQYVTENPNARWVSSYIRIYNEEFCDEKCLKRKEIVSSVFFNSTVSQQLKMMASFNYLYAPSLFFNVAMKREIGGYDLTYIAEDYPFYIKALEKGYKCFFMPSESVSYRVHQSLSRSGNHLFNYDFQKKMRTFRMEHCFKYLSKREIMGIKLRWGIEDIVEHCGLNKNNHFMRFLYSKINNLIEHIF